MALFRVSNERAQFDAAGNEASDQYGAGIRFTQGGNARVTTGSATNYNQGIPMSSTGQVAIVDATAGLPAGTIFHNGLPMSGDKVCVSRNATSIVSNGMPYDSAGAVAADVNLDLNFIGTDTLNSSVTFTRASTATYFNSAGVLTSAAIDVPRFDYNPATLAARGLLIEEQRTNSIRNNTMQGAVAGTPGTLPTNWSVFAASGLTTTVVSTGTSNGITYIDLRFSGTSTATFYVIAFDNSPVAASAGQSWTESFWVSLIGGSLTNINSCNLNIRWSVGGSADIPFTPTATFTRLSGTGTAPVGATNVTPAFFISMANGAAIDITLRIGLPQLEQGAFATSVIPTTTTALTRSADVASVNTLSPWYNQTNGTVYAEFAPVFQGSATAAGNNPGVWGATQNGLGSFNGYGVRLFAQSNFSDNINGVSRYAPSGFNTQVNIGPSAFLNLGQTYKTAFAWEASGIAASRDGQAVVTSTNPAAAAMGTHDQFYLGRQNIGGTPTQLNGYLRRLTYYPRRLSNAELQAITV